MSVRDFYKQRSLLRASTEYPYASTTAGLLYSHWRRLADRRQSPHSTARTPRHALAAGGFIHGVDAGSHRHGRTFLSVLGHELSHALMGRAEGIEIRDRACIHSVVSPGCAPNRKTRR